jgi:hypothetical protein
MSGFQPAKGLTQLTTTQILTLDTKLRSLCSYAETTGQELMLVIHINRNGKPISIGEPIRMEKFSPTPKLST